MGDESDLDRTMRSETTCRGCGGPKQTDLLVCWGCFKAEPSENNGIPPLKYSGRGVAEWLASLPAAREAFAQRKVGDIVGTPFGPGVIRKLGNGDFSDVVDILPPEG